jgi:hypothetical protein
MKYKRNKDENRDQRTQFLRNKKVRLVLKYYSLWKENVIYIRTQKL